MRVIQLDGCMAHVRNYRRVTRARIVAFGSLPDSYNPGRYDGVQLQNMEDNRITWLPRLGWVERLGIMEYHV